MERPITSVKNEKDYQRALARMERIFDARKGSKEGDELEILATLVDAYEKKHFLK